MRLTRLALRDFRNLPELALETDARFVVFAGENAQGKTNVLEAIYALATLKSFRTHKRRELLRWGQDEAVIAGTVVSEGVTRRYKLRLTASEREPKVDDQVPRPLSSYFDGVRAVLFAPEDTAMVRGEPAGRRAFVDRAAFTLRPAHLDLVRAYGRVLSQRGALLRAGGDPLQLEVLDSQLVQLGAKLSVRRDEVVAELATPFSELYAGVSGGRSATVRYRSVLGEGDEASRRERFLEKLAERRDDELRRGINLVGPQRADLDLRIEGQSARAFGSQGQVRSVVLALKLAQLQVADRRGLRPLFLLDDLSSELDEHRTAHLLELLGELGLQTFVTTTDVGRLAALPAAEQLVHRVSKGRISRA